MIAKASSSWRTWFKQKLTLRIRERLSIPEGGRIQCTRNGCSNTYSDNKGIKLFCSPSCRRARHNPKWLLAG